MNWKQWTDDRLIVILFGSVALGSNFERYNNNIS